MKAPEQHTDLEVELLAACFPSPPFARDQAFEIFGRFGHLCDRAHAFSTDPSVYMSMPKNLWDVHIAPCVQGERQADR